MLVNEDFLKEDLVRLHKENESLKNRNLRNEQIEYEFNLYKCFCKLCNLKMCEYSSLMEFQDYCNQNNIKLI